MEKFLNAKRGGVLLVLLLSLLVFSCTPQNQAPLLILGGGSSHTVSFEANLPDGLVEIPEAKRVKDGEKLGDVAPTTTDSNLEFIQWEDENGIPYDKDSIITSDILLIARWKSTWDGTAIDKNSISSQLGNKEILIQTAADLAGFAALVNESNTFAGKTIMLRNDIDLAGKEWTPIGIAANSNVNHSSNKPFCGDFNGLNRSIKGVSITDETNGGFFGMVLNASIIDLSIEGTITATDFGGGIVSRAYYTEPGEYTLTGLDSAVSVTAEEAGGIAGYVNISETASLTIKDVHNAGKISASDESGYAGGLIGELINHGKLEISGSTNDENVSGTQTYSIVGGIVGRSENEGEITISNTFNNAEVAGGNGTYTTDEYGSYYDFAYAGGMFGCLESEISSNSITISDSGNIAPVTAGEYSYAGGYIGHSAGCNITITGQNSNSGAISSGLSAGGLIGRILTEDYGDPEYSCASMSSISGFTNTGAVSGGTGYSGGIIGVMSASMHPITVTISASKNENNVETTGIANNDAAGGFIGLMEMISGNITGNVSGTNSGNIKATANAGGFIGWILSASNENTLSLTMTDTKNECESISATTKGSFIGLANGSAKDDSSISITNGTSSISSDAIGSCTICTPDITP